LHSTSPANICRWGAFDVDRHDDDIDPDRTLAVALTLYCLALERGFRPLLTDSNGAGGYHMRLGFRPPVPSRDLYFPLRTMARQAGFAGETFPKQPQLRGPFGNWLRLPGRHGTRDHWARAFDGSGWLSGADAAGWLLGFDGDDPVLVPRAPAER